MSSVNSEPAFNSKLSVNWKPAIDSAVDSKPVIKKKRVFMSLKNTQCQSVGVIFVFSKNNKGCQSGNTEQQWTVTQFLPWSRILCRIEMEIISNKSEEGILIPQVTNTLGVTFYFLKHEFHENHHSITSYFMKKDCKLCAIPKRQSQFTPKMKANAVPRLLSSLVWIDQ